MRRSKNRIPRRISAKRSEPSHLLTANTERTRWWFVSCGFFWISLLQPDKRKLKKTRELALGTFVIMKYLSTEIVKDRVLSAVAMFLFLQVNNIKPNYFKHWPRQNKELKVIESWGEVKHAILKRLQLLALLWVSCAINSLSNIKPNQDLNVWPLSNWF